MISLDKKQKKNHLNTNNTQATGKKESERDDEKTHIFDKNF